MAQKSVGLIINETKEQIANIINTSGLPPSITSLILQGFLSQTSIAEQNELKFDMEQYNQQVDAEKKTNESTKPKVRNDDGNNS